MKRRAGLLFFARHEARLAWRDALAMLQGGRRKLRGAAIALLVISAVLHLIAYAIVKPHVEALAEADKPAFVAISISALLAFALMLSQAMESATRSFYARGDLDLILSAPVLGRRIFAIRICTILATCVGMAAVSLGPFINMAAWLLGPRFLLAYGVIFAMGCVATSIAVAAIAVLFKLAGAARTRLLSQVIAAFVGAGFVIGIQAFAILSYGSMSTTQLFTSDDWLSAAPERDSIIWLPVSAATGDLHDLFLLLAAALAIFSIITAAVAGNFARNAYKVAGLSQSHGVRSIGPVDLRLRSPVQTLRRKEWVLLLRDPWLISQTLMQLLYLAPPALMLWRNFGKGTASVVLIPVIVMAAGQLAGGLAWLAISGEDAPDLVATAPIQQPSILRAKIEAVMIAIALPVLPLVAAMALISPFAALATAVGAGFAAAAACALQFFFKGQSRRSNFRRRQTSSRIATLAEAFSSISIAATMALAANGRWAALIPATFASIIILSSRALTRPQ